MELDYSGRKERDGQKKKISKANERKRKVKRGKDKEVNGQGGKEGPHTGESSLNQVTALCNTLTCEKYIHNNGDKMCTH